MGEEFYSVIKLISGEEIFALISIDENDGDAVVVVQNPLIMKMVSSPKGGFIKVRKWIEISDDNMFVLKYDKILTMTECKDKKVIAIYNNYIEDDDEIEIYKTTGQVQPDASMGFLSTVDDARKKFEELFNNNQEPKES